MATSFALRGIITAIIGKSEKNVATDSTTVYIPLLQIGSLILERPVLLAPLCDITNSPYRLLCRRNGAAMVFTEMVSAEGIVRNQAKTWALARFTPEERPLGIQIFSHDTAILGEAAARLESLQPDVIDLNFGCPVKKVVRRGAGAGFMESPERIAQAVRSVVAATRLPVTAKLRLGPKPDRVTAIEAAQAAQAEGAAAVTVHGRTTDQGFSGQANWELIARVKQSVTLPVIGNGDIYRGEDARRMIEQTGVDGVMVGRGMLGNPWIFAACAAALEDRPWQPLTPAQRWPDVEYHYRRSVETRGLKGLREMRKFLAWYSRGLPGAAEFRARVVRMEDPEEVLAVTRDFFVNHQANHSESPIEQAI
ncbi:MAG: tRNA dihydrouridine synthase DusB [Candidatus Zixiibacteriota bacterium]|nr:MAG: tRNA dihydrouridine synthase DusB [candidate division Zixibacteria bacterium]